MHHPASHKLQRITMMLNVITFIVAFFDLCKAARAATGAPQTGLNLQQLGNDLAIDLNEVVAVQVLASSTPGGRTICANIALRGGIFLSVTEPQARQVSHQVSAPNPDPAGQSSGKGSGSGASPINFT